MKNICLLDLDDPRLSLVSPGIFEYMLKGKFTVRLASGEEWTGRIFGSVHVVPCSDPFYGPSVSLRLYRPAGPEEIENIPNGQLKWLAEIVLPQDEAVALGETLVKDPIPIRIPR